MNINMGVGFGIGQNDFGIKKIAPIVDKMYSIRELV